MVDRLVDAGCVWWKTLDLLPPSITDHEPRPDDDRFRFVTGRRPTAEWVFANATNETEGVTVRRGVGIEALVTGPSAVDGIPHVTGVRTSAGDEVRADLVVDAMGRRSPLVDWLDRARRPRTTGRVRGARIRLLHPLLRGPRGSRDDRPTTRPDGDVLAAHLAGRQRLVVRHDLGSGGRHRAPQGPGSRQLRQGAAGVPVPHALAGRPAHHRRARDGRDSRQVPALRRRGSADCNRHRRGRRRVGVHQSVGRARDQRRLVPCAVSPRCDAGRSRRRRRVRARVR